MPGCLSAPRFALPAGWGLPARPGRPACASPNWAHEPSVFRTALSINLGHLRSYMATGNSSSIQGPYAPDDYPAFLPLPSPKLDRKQDGKLGSSRDMSDGSCADDEYLRLSSQHPSAPAGAKLSFRDSSARCPGRASKPSSPRSRSSPTVALSIRPSNRTMSASSTSRWMSSTWSSSPTASPTSSRTSIRYTSSPRLSQVLAGPWRSGKS